MHYYCLGSPVAAEQMFLRDLYDEFEKSFGAPASVAEKRSGWEDPLDAWNRCFEHVRAGDVELDGEVPVVTLLTPKPKELKAGLERYQARVRNAMRKAFGARCSWCLGMKCWRHEQSSNRSWNIENYGFRLSFELVLPICNHRSS